MANRVEAVDRALVLLVLLAERGRLSVTEAGRELGVAPSTAHRLLGTLCHRGFAVRGEDRVYHPGPQWLGAARAQPPGLVQRMRPYLESLYAATNETVHLMVRVGAEVVFMDGIEGVRALRVGLRVGMRMPAHRTSGGKAMLADLDRSAVDALYAERPPWEDDPFPYRDGRLAYGGTGTAPPGGAPACLHRELDAVRRDGHGRNEDESEPGVTALGASVGHVDGHHTALAVAVPTVRAASTEGAALAGTLLAVCREARRALRPAHIPRPVPPGNAAPRPSP